MRARFATRRAREEPACMPSRWIVLCVRVRVGARGAMYVALGREFVVDLQPLAGHAELVRVGRYEQPTNRHQRLPVACHADLAPDVTGWLCDPSQERFDPRPEGIHVLDSLPPLFAGDSDGYRYRRICTFWTKPISAKKVTMPEPPYEMNGSGKPVMGMMPTVMAMFWKICHSSIVNTPTQR